MPHVSMNHPSPKKTSLVFHHPNDLPNKRTKVIDIIGFRTGTTLKESPAAQAH